MRGASFRASFCEGRWQGIACVELHLDTKIRVQTSQQHVAAESRGSAFHNVSAETTCSPWPIHRVDARENITPREGDVNVNEVSLDNAGEELSAPRQPRHLSAPGSTEKHANSFQTPQSPSYLRRPGATSTSQEDMNEQGDHDSAASADELVHLNKATETSKREHLKVLVKLEDNMDDCVLAGLNLNASCYHLLATWLCCNDDPESCIALNMLPLTNK